jgi:hypothetical protein
MKKSFYVMMVFTSLFFAGAVYAATPAVVAQPRQMRQVQQQPQVQAQVDATQWAAPSGQSQWGGQPVQAGGGYIGRGMMGGNSSMMGRSVRGGNVQFGGYTQGYQRQSQPQQIEIQQIPAQTRSMAARRPHGSVVGMFVGGLTTLLVWVFLILGIKVMWFKLKKQKMGGCCHAEAMLETAPEVMKQA